MRRALFIYALAYVGVIAVLLRLPGDESTLMVPADIEDWT